nr:hypothetical protein [Candidatus Njordarchaeum guaymaensis]
MEGSVTEASIDRFLTGKLRKTIMLDELFATYLPQFIAGKEKVRFKLKNALIDSASFVQGDQNIHAYFYFKPQADANFELKIGFKDGRIVAKGNGKWGNMGELIDIDEELKGWIANLYSIGIMRENKKITVTPRNNGSRIELPVKKHDKEWREAHQKMNATPKKIVEDIFNIANRIVSGIANWQGKQVDPWNPSELSKGRATVAPLTPTPLSPVPPVTAGSTLPPLPPIPSEEPTASRVALRPVEPRTLEPPEAQGPVQGATVICPTCGVENPPGSKTCKRCMTPIEY